MNLVSLNIDTIPLGQPLPFVLRGGDGVLLAQGTLDRRPRLAPVEDDRLVVDDAPLVEHMGVAADGEGPPARIHTGGPEMARRVEAGHVGGGEQAVTPEPDDRVIAQATWHPAREIRQDGLGHLSPGAVADLAVLRLEQGRFGFIDSFGARMAGTSRLSVEMTLKDGRIVYDVNGLGRPEWTTLPADYRAGGDPKWDATRR